MIRSIERNAIVETLLNSLEAERHVRGALLATIVDELTAAGEELEPAATFAHAILERWQAGQLGEPELAARIRALRPLIQVRHAAPESGVRVVRERASAA